MSTPNIERFNEYTARIFATLRWLEKAEYIWCKGGIQLGTIAVLSPKGLEALRATPTSLERG